MPARRSLSDEATLEKAQDGDEVEDDDVARSPIVGDVIDGPYDALQPDGIQTPARRSESEGATLEKEPDGEEGAGRDSGGPSSGTLSCEFGIALLGMLAERSLAGDS